METGDEKRYIESCHDRSPDFSERINAGKLADDKPIEVVLTDANGTEEWWNTDNGTVRVIADGDGNTSCWVIRICIRWISLVS